MPEFYTPIPPITLVLILLVPIMGYLAQSWVKMNVFQLSEEKKNLWVVLIFIIQGVLILLILLFGTTCFDPNGWCPINGGRSFG
jgi:uncharacterized membrane protein YqjE